MLQKYTCKLCTVEVSFEERNVTPFHVEHGVCEMCMGDIYVFLQSSHLLRNEELSLKVNLRKMRNILQRVDSPKYIDQTLERVRTEVFAIERQLEGFIQDYPSVSEALSEYHSLIRVYR
ncbi:MULTISPECIES: hypothetical protein [unclassified Vibrio]|uniref:hypothetical protein n=1 Tax=unclassified Vibrio TaxID=2614977 RepID=UPI000B8E2D8F|nr:MULTISPECIES: hypothetical protein [unclassified Vibrio]NAW90988.1 hypothetical protein [Vibrio sp. V24_P1S3T111]OXX22041.1 hypothetical protein B9J86_09875 [Vibrio sp. V06_P1A73T115]OXX24490.1 hypothetical protein B9J88_05645 [Vibrio sp. V05_P4A8T149]OXX29257.1 hypothetical protein B9J95_13945 [Vibrio sp. V14_P6S14T42]OXX30142.1 hypothetical protein B9J81_16705 [Vibrio sp. V04_P4A5T148]